MAAQRRMNGGPLPLALLGSVPFVLSGCTLGLPEMLIILVIVVLLFGATRLPQLGKALGETVKSFRKSSGIDTLEDQRKGDVVKIEDAKVEPADEDRGSGDRGSGDRGSGDRGSGDRGSGKTS